MLTITREFFYDKYDPFPGLVSDTILYFDIETTGFSADTSFVYLIGCCYKEQEHFHSIQWFADTYDSEPLLLHTFFEFIKNFSYLIHFNGDTFDLPFLLKKCRQYSLNYNFSDIESIDIYKKIAPYRKQLCLSNLKLKTVEHFLAIPRKDTMDGGQLIKTYRNYMKGCIEQADAKTLSEQKNLLLLHNQEDVENLPAVTQILSLLDLFESLPELVCCSFENFPQTPSDTINDNPVIENISLKVTFSIPERFSSLLKKNFFSFMVSNTGRAVTLSFQNTSAFLSLPVICDTLKYYYPNYKDYFYLPKEEKAIHKSVGIYVEKEYRKKATADTAYQKQYGYFLPQLEAVFTPSFQYQRKDKICFFQITDEWDVTSEQLQLVLLQWWKKLLLYSK